MPPDFILEKREKYVALNFPVVEASQSSNPTRSLRRRWNQLPRLLRILIVLSIIVVSILFLSHLLKNESLPITFSETYENEELKVTAIFGGRDIVQSANVHKKDPSIIGNVDALEDIKGDDNIVNKDGYSHQEAVVAAMKHAWKGYRKYAWGHDHLLPISKSRHNWVFLGLTIIDSLDTLWMMNLTTEFNDAKEWVETQLDFNINRDINLFETTIRVLGGLLSTYHLTKEKVFLDKAIDLGDRLIGAFESDSGIPYSDVNLMTKKPAKPRWGPDSSTSEVTTIQLEFRDLSRVTGNSIYAEKVNFVTSHIHKQQKLDGLVPIFINAQTGLFRQLATITLGARGDSYYEYLLKQWVQMGKKEDTLRSDYIEAVNGMKIHLGRRTHPNKLLFFGELHGGGKNFVNKMDELSCFLPGTLALGVSNGMPPGHMKIATDLMYTCAQTWLKQPTSLAPEITFFNTAEAVDSRDFYVKSNDAHYLLRPETIESLWYLYYFTGNKTYQEWGWKMFQGIEKYCKVENGYTTIANVKSTTSTRPKDMMESFFLAETLKYFYLLFSDDQKLYPLDKWVFNTEGHPLPIYNNLTESILHTVLKTPDIVVP